MSFGIHTGIELIGILTLTRGALEYFNQNVIEDANGYANQKFTSTLHPSSSKLRM